MCDFFGKNLILVVTPLGTITTPERARLARLARVARESRRRDRTH